MRKKFPENLEELRARLLEDVPNSRLMKTVRGALKERGNWKNKPRGEPNYQISKFTGIKLAPVDPTFVEEEWN